MSEYSEQVSIFRWANQYAHIDSRLLLLHASLNGVKLSQGAARKAKQAGMVAGVPDIFLPVACGGYHGLYIELKVGKNTATKAQLEFMALVKKQGYLCRVCYGADEAINTIVDYLNEK